MAESSSSKVCIKKEEGSMKYRIAMWASVGFLVASCWAVYAMATFPFTNERMHEPWVMILSRLTCPVAMAGGVFPLPLSWVVVVNAVTYGLAGFMLETLRRRWFHLNQALL
jgi:hypothetical protein